MKTLKTFLIIFFAGIILSGCKEKNTNIEIVPNLESIYTSVNDVDTPPKLDKDFYNKVNNDLLKAIKNLRVTNSNIWTVFDVDLRIYVNENGTIDKIKDLFSDKNNFRSPDSVKLYTDRVTMDNKIAQTLADWKFEPAIKNGKRVKFWMDINMDFTLKPNGNYIVGLPSFLLNYPPPDEFVAVDKMPQAVGTIIPHYPELAKRAGLEGSVYVKVLVDEAGKPLKAIVIKSDHEIFNQTSIDAAMQFQFTPAKRDNKPVAVWVVVPFRYRLDGSKGELMHYKDLKDMPPKK